MFPLGTFGQHNKDCRLFLYTEYNLEGVVLSRCWGRGSGMSYLHVLNRPPRSASLRARIMHHVTTLRSSLTDNMTMSSLDSNGFHSHQISVQSRTFGTKWNGRLSSWMELMMSCQDGPEPLCHDSSFLDS
nr:uncharacterized protein LOC129165394 isoform X2 [Nothobranchius furzeri]